MPATIQVIQWDKAVYRKRDYLQIRVGYTNATIDGMNPCQQTYARLDDARFYLLSIENVIIGFYDSISQAKSAFLERV